MTWLLCRTSMTHVYDSASSTSIEPGAELLALDPRGVPHPQPNFFQLNLFGAAQFCASRTRVGTHFRLTRDYRLLRHDPQHLLAPARADGQIRRANTSGALLNKKSFHDAVFK